ncbi:terminal deoxynucleotidyl transferas-like protein [Bimuria novae-zelandiae CBS 107.79]|uniref:Terminal deoxynucleotidyl transferas-like protein n=1 Tax=Bimuria novae-zelandiae CBS 107.79 TaxID=1447943 RepID=A0A6A5UKX1_9PLEO|nr:terminal deoxynucleotidyl transferas-like protein [Bimuria novae-zelandiae CBS 107.79]
MEDNVPTVGSPSSDHMDLATVPGLDFSSIPPISVLNAHFKGEEEDRVKATLRRHGAQLTADVSKVKVFVGKVGTRKRAEFELRARKFEIDEVVELKRVASPIKQDGIPHKRVKVRRSVFKPIQIEDEGSTTEEEVDEVSETEDEAPKTRDTPISSPVLPDEQPVPIATPIFEDTSTDDIIRVVRIDWLNECLSAGRLVPLGENLVYRGKVKKRPPASLGTDYASIKATFTSSHKAASQTQVATRPSTAPHILDRAKEDASIAPVKRQPYHHHGNDGHGSRRFEGRTFTSSASQPTFTHQTAHLLQQTTSEYEGEDTDIPPPPDWVARGLKYACQRFTPANPPNEVFIEQLKKIRTARTLIDDAIGVRAYSSIIAAIAAYPFKLSHPRELARLPGCDEKTAALFVEWKNTGSIQAVEDYEADEVMGVLRAFYDIWGVGAKTARNFYYGKGWRDLDDIVEYGWNGLDRVQQIGLKYYDEFLEPIPRAEVEGIAEVVRQHAVRLRDERVSVTIVGGYRRGKTASGDVDLIVSHPCLAATAHLVRDLVDSLEAEDWITHTLTLSLHNTSRGQTTLPFRTTKASGAGFDTLDKALVVWQDPAWPTRAADLAANPKANNPNIHRRVDIIVSPWRTVGCAVMGWSGGTTFQRDLRRYAKYAKGWKFDSSGVRSRESGEVVELEGSEGVDGPPEEAERRVFEGLGLEYVPPEMRCTN